ncbi:MAG: anaerobic ribonucleoside-triphosphate reductase [Nanoarchaeota archaeon]
MSKYDILTSVAEKVKALDNEVKLKILALLVEEGSKSITDISKELGINFSTTHKYLEQLEAVGLVSSKQVSENRLKRQFTIKDFSIDLSPKGLSELVSGKAAQDMKGGLKVLNENGQLVDFDEKLFSQKYLKRGMPRSTIVSAITSTLEQAYDGITILELRRAFKSVLEKKVENIGDVFKQIADAEKHERTYTHLLQTVHPEALEMHATGDIFIQNLGMPKLLNFIHDLHGIAQHGVTGKRPGNAREFFAQIIFAIKEVSKYTMRYQSLDTFNYLIAPFAEQDMPKFLEELKKFLSDAEELDREIFLCLDIGQPEFIAHLPVAYVTESKHGEKTETYEKYHAIADNIIQSIINIVLKEKYKNIILIIKNWDKTPQLKQLPAGTYIANMADKWQHPTASFAGFTRFDSTWKKWFGTNRVGEVQEIVINLPKIANNSSSPQDFIAKTAKLIDACHNLLLFMAELNAGEFLRNYNCTFPSSQRERWNYLHLEDCSYSIGIAGLAETIELLHKKYKNVDLSSIAADIYKHFNETKKRFQIRVNLKQSRSRAISARLSRFSGMPIKYNYALPKNQLQEIQKLFPGGHVEFLTLPELDKLNGKFYFARLI